jgi:hypothetical protein
VRKAILSSEEMALISTGETQGEQGLLIGENGLDQIEITYTGENIIQGEAPDQREEKAQSPCQPKRT